MRKVLHVGPAKTPGGMATVMRTLAENPPNGWVSQTITTHTDGSILAKLRIWRKAKHQISQLLANKTMEGPDVVHIHTAADWSFHRKSSVMRLCKKYNVPCILHIHSGRFDSWLGKPSTRATKRVRNSIRSSGASVVVLTQKWSERLEPFIGKSQAIFNPILPISSPNKERDITKILLMGRPDPIKGASLAIGAVKFLRSEGYDITLHLTGVTPGHRWSHTAESEGAVVAHGWLSEIELEELRSEVGLLLVPSAWEGQPMVIIEAMARGIPILASNSCAEHVGASGRVVKSMESEDWAYEIKNLLGDNTALRAMSEAGRVKAKMHFIDSVNEKWKILYDSLV